MAAGPGRGASRLPAAGALLLVLTVLPLYAFYTTPRYAADDYRPLIAQIAALGQPDDAILTVFPWQVGYLESYYPPPRPRIVEAPGSRSGAATPSACARIWMRCSPPRRACGSRPTRSTAPSWSSRWRPT